MWIVISVIHKQKLSLASNVVIQENSGKILYTSYIKDVLFGFFTFEKQYENVYFVLFGL